MANGRKARMGLLKLRGVLGKLTQDHEDKEGRSPEGKRCKDRTAAHKRPADWKKKKKEKRRAYNKARREGR